MVAAQIGPKHLPCSFFVKHYDPPTLEEGPLDHESFLVPDGRSRLTSTSSEGLGDQLGSGQDTELNCASSCDRSSVTSPHVILTKLITVVNQLTKSSTIREIVIRCYSWSARLFSQTRNPHSQQKNVFYFYQSSDGQAIFMHSLNVQMLVSQYGSLEFCPEVIEGKIVEIECLSMNDEVRKRMRYLGHISISKQFQIAEIAIDESLIDPSILHEFQGELHTRLEWNQSIMMGSINKSALFRSD